MHTFCLSLDVAITSIFQLKARKSILTTVFLPGMRVQLCQEDKDTALTGRPPPPLGAALQPFCRPPLKCLQFCEITVLRSVRGNTDT